MKPTSSLSPNQLEALQEVVKRNSEVRALVEAYHLTPLPPWRVGVSAEQWQFNSAKRDGELAVLSFLGLLEIKTDE